MKIAVITDDEETISQHFGRARYYRVFSIENGKVVSVETREKANHNHFASEHDHEHGHGSGARGTDPASAQRHKIMMDVIADCQVALVRGMGMGAYNALEARGIRPIVTDIHEIDRAVEAYLQGSIIHHPGKLH